MSGAYAADQNPYLRQPSGVNQAPPGGWTQGGEGWQDGGHAEAPAAGPNAFTNTNLMNQLLEIAEAENASDLHLVAGAPPVLRINGRLVPVEARS